MTVGTREYSVPGIYFCDNEVVDVARVPVFDRRGLSLDCSVKHRQ